MRKSQKDIEIDQIENILDEVSILVGWDVNTQLEQCVFECPDFLIPLADGLKLGIELVECHPSASSNSKKTAKRDVAYNDGICKELVKMLSDDAVLNDNILEGKKLNIIISKSNNSIKKDNLLEVYNDIRTRVWAYSVGVNYQYRSKYIRKIRFLETRGKHIIQINRIGGKRLIQWKYVKRSIENKVGKYDSYQLNCQECWLCIFIPWEEYCQPLIDNYDSIKEEVEQFLNSCPFKRIYLTTGVPKEYFRLK